MKLSYRCPQCEQPHIGQQLADASSLNCECGWSRTIPADLMHDGRPTQCVVCGNADLWRQKNFPQGWGVLIVTIGAIISSIFYAYYQPLWAMGTLMIVALLDMGLYIWMPDVLVCYRCQSRHADVSTEGHPDFSHELFEKYRQEAIRQQQVERKD
ncbi:MAG: hypothetical protein KDA58_05940 [Planctomycetaceae bacterium]|nr:hypothetical protein [Planctomycetaceae bacterium]